VPISDADAVCDRLEGNVSTPKVEAVNIQQTKKDGAGELPPWRGVG
jgi:hypothetical protein